MPVKYLAGEPLMVKYVGMAHGVLFLVYIVAAFAVADQLKWSARTRMLSIVAAILPFGPIVFDRKYLGDTTTAQA
jgi:integral membrane protein